MSPAALGDTVTVHYTATLPDGSVVDSSRGREPIRITLGGGQVIPGFEEALVGMSAGESKTVCVPPAKGYGDRAEELVFEVPRSSYPAGVQPEVGQRLQMTFEEGGHPLDAVVTAVTESTVTLDANHRMAGRDLVFDLLLVGIE